MTRPRVLIADDHPVIADAPHPVFGLLAGALSEHYRTPYERLWMNWYRDHDDSTGWHADRPANRRPEATIPVLSLGATRRFLIRPAGGRAPDPRPASPSGRCSTRRDCRCGVGCSPRASRRRCANRAVPRPPTNGRGSS